MKRERGERGIDVSRRCLGPAWSWRLLLIGLLLGGTLLRWAALGPMSREMLHHDEAYKAVDALNLLRDFRLTPFLPGNFGHESGWVYLLMPFLLALGSGIFAVRFTAAVNGVLTLAAAYRLGRELFGRRAGVWGVGALSVLYWHVHVSQLALRGNLYLFLGTLAAGVLLTAYRKQRSHLWVVGGALLGLLAYTYFASVLWGAYLGLGLVSIILFDRRRRRDAILALLVGSVIALPMAHYARLHPDQVLARSTTVSARSLPQLLANGRAWLQALFVRGDANAFFNLPERPILGPFTGLLGALGLLGVAARRRWRLPGSLLLGWALAALVPSLFSNYAPHFFRGIGLTVPLALVLGAGGAVLYDAADSMLSRMRLSGPAKAATRAVTFALPLALLGGAGLRTYRDFHMRWLQHPEAFTAMEVHVNRAANLIKAETTPDTHVYFSPFTPAHPVVILRGRDLAPRPVGAFNSHECFVVPEAEATYVSLTLYEPSFAETLAQWADVTTLCADVTNAAPRPRYTVFSADPHALVTSEPDGQFDHAFSVWLLTALPDTVVPGASVSLTLGIRALQPPEIDPSLFIHLYGIPTPYEGGTMWSQADSQLCTSYPAHLWRPDETIIQSFVLPVPADAPPGDYVIAMGLYPFPDGTRLPVTAPRGSEHDYVVLKTLRIAPAR